MEVTIEGQSEGYSFRAAIFSYIKRSLWSESSPSFCIELGIRPNSPLNLSDLSNKPTWLLSHHLPGLPLLPVFLSRQFTVPSLKLCSSSVKM